MNPFSRITLYNPAANSPLGYRSDIDGLRAIAVISVVIYHAGSTVFTGGFVGVDIFFVISGYLITSIILKDIEFSNFSMARFYERRARRILPVLFFILFVTLLVNSQILIPDDYKILAISTIYTIFFAANIFFAFIIGDYFGTGADFQPLLHTWSLAVEEQFYIVFPLLLLLIINFQSYIKNSIIIVVVFISFIHSIILTDIAPVWAFYLVTTRVWELGAGALIAMRIIPPCRSQFLCELSGATGLILIAVPILIFDSNMPFPGFAALVPCLGAALIIWSGTNASTLVSQLLSIRPLIFFGLISYSLYLWHWPIMTALREYYASTNLTMKQASFAVVISVLLSTVTWVTIERPFRDTKRFGRAAVFRISGIGAVAMAAVSMVIIGTDGKLARIPEAASLIAAGSRDFNPRREECFDKAPEEGLCSIGLPTVEKSFLLWGDSHALAMMSGFDIAAQAAGTAGWFAGSSSCRPLLGVRPASRPTCTDFNEKVLHFIKSNSDIKTIFLVARWAPFTTAGYNENDDIPVIIDDFVNSDSLNINSLFAAGVRRTLLALKDAGREVFLVTNVPEIGWGVPRRLLREVRWAEPLPELPNIASVRARMVHVDSIFRSAENDGLARVVDFTEDLCTPECIIIKDDRPLYYDSHHLSEYASRSVIAPLIARRIWGYNLTRIP